MHELRTRQHILHACNTCAYTCIHIHMGIHSSCCCLPWSACSVLHGRWRAAGIVPRLYTQGAFLPSLEARDLRRAREEEEGEQLTHVAGFLACSRRSDHHDACSYGPRILHHKCAELEHAALGRCCDGCGDSGAAVVRHLPEQEVLEWQHYGGDRVYGTGISRRGRGRGILAHAAGLLPAGEEDAAACKIRLNIWLFVFNTTHCAPIPLRLRGAMHKCSHPIIRLHGPCMPLLLLQPPFQVAQTGDDDFLLLLLLAISQVAQARRACPSAFRAAITQPPSGCSQPGWLRRTGHSASAC